MNTPEQEARELLDRLGVLGALRWSSGDLLELANLIAEVRRYREPESDEAWMRRVYPDHMFAPDDGIPYDQWCRRVRASWEAEHREWKSRYEDLRQRLTPRGLLEAFRKAGPDEYLDASGPIEGRLDVTLDDTWDFAEVVRVLLDDGRTA